MATTSCMSVAVSNFGAEWFVGGNVLCNVSLCAVGVFYIGYVPNHNHLTSRFSVKRIYRQRSMAASKGTKKAVKSVAVWNSKSGLPCFSATVSVLFWLHNLGQVSVHKRTRFRA